MKPAIYSLFLFTAALFSIVSTASAAEYTGQFQTTMVANVEDDERVIFKFDTGERLKSAGTFADTTHIAMGKLEDPRTGQFSVLAFLVEDKGKEPLLYADLNDDHLIAADEKYTLQRGVDDTYIWSTTVLLPVNDGGMFKLCPINVRYFKNYTTTKMGPEDRLVLQSKEVMASAKVNIKGKDVLFQYAYNFQDKKIDPQNSWLGVDADGNGEIDMNSLSPEAARANKETVVFRVGDTYLSTKKADVAANQVIIREHSASEYKRAELHMNKPFPDFSFTDFDGKKHKLSEYRGKYVLLDMWGFWCPNCNAELPYIREANKRFASRNLQVVGVNTDRKETGIDVVGSMKNNQMTWPQAQYSSVQELLDFNLRIESYPTTFLIGPDGNILSMSRPGHDEPYLRGKDLLTSLDEVLPKS